MTTPKTLYILRHAKAEIGSPNQEDKSRKLVERGEHAAQIVGAYLFRQGIKPNKIICSDAQRTRQTWAQIESIYTSPQNIDYASKLYLASASEMLSLLTPLPDAVSSVMMIGHNPGVHQLALKLAKKGDEDLIDTMNLKFPTCALAVIALGDIAWDDVMHAQGTLIDFVTPKMLAGISDD